jgi:hypothetical protein
VLAAAPIPSLLVAADAAGERLRTERPRVVVEFEKGALTVAEASAFADLADRGVADIEALVAESLPPSVRRTRRVRFIVSDDVGMSRAYRSTVILPLDRVRSHSAPYLHEIVHVLVPSHSDRTWLTEGLASYLESWVSENRGGYDAHIFTRAGDRDIHAAARRYLGNDAGRAVLPWVGDRGDPPRLEDDRWGVARPFYVLSHSLTKFLVDDRGLSVVVRLLTSTDGDIVGITGRSAEAWKAAWLQSLASPARTRR